MSRVFGVVAVLLLLPCLLHTATLPAYAGGTVTWQVAGSNFIKDSDGSTNLTTGNYIQLWDVDNDVLLDEAAIGDGLFGSGQFSKAGLSLSPDTYTINIRAYNKPKENANDPDACSGTSTPQTITVTATSVDTIDFTGFSTTTCPAQYTAVELVFFRATGASEGSLRSSLLVAAFSLLTAVGLGLTVYHRGMDTLAPLPGIPPEQRRKQE